MRPETFLPFLLRLNHHPLVSMIDTRGRQLTLQRLISLLLLSTSFNEAANVCTQRCSVCKSFSSLFPTHLALWIGSDYHSAATLIIYPRLFPIQPVNQRYTIIAVTMCDYEEIKLSLRNCSEQRRWRGESWISTEPSQTRLESNVLQQSLLVVVEHFLWFLARFRSNRSATATICGRKSETLVKHFKL